MPPSRSEAGFRRIVPAALVATLLFFVPACGSERDPIDGARAWRRVKEQVDFGPRIPGTPGHGKMRAWLVAELTRLGATVEQQSFVDSSLGRALPVVNVIARWPAAGGSSRHVLLCAHWDSRPWSDQEADSTHWNDPCPGANDAGSGVAVLLEVAECLARKRAPVAVDLGFWDAEDLGRPTKPDEFSIGARGYAHRLPPAGDPRRPVAAFLFDMVGDRDLDIWVENQSEESAANLVSMVLEAAHETGGAHFHSTVGYTITDDHVPLLEAGLPAVDIIDFNYPAWHTRADLPDQVSPASLAEVSRVAAWLVYRSPLARL